jgi:NAD(P)-dependent dehydrogenase (short-subunit alcohol dehydrogenase family)
MHARCEAWRACRTLVEAFAERDVCDVPVARRSIAPHRAGRRARLSTGRRDGGSTVTWKPQPGSLRGTVALVAGATRGAGRGIALGLGEAGATVVCTGRSSRTRALASDYAGRPETVEQTADLVTELGGTGVAAVVDHLDPAQVQQLADRVRAEHGHLDVLVDDIWGAEILKGAPPQWNTPIWEHDLEAGLRIMRLAVETHLVTSHHLLPLVIDRPGGLVVEVTDGTAEYNALHYRISAFYDLAKTSINRLAWILGHELAGHGATALAITPGWLRSEMMLEAFGTTEATWRDAAAPPGFATSESPRYIGRAVAAIAADPQRSRWNQRSVTVAEVADVYGFTDTDGSRPDSWRYMRDADADPGVDPADYR